MAVAAGSASSMLPLLQIQHPMHLYQAASGPNGMGAAPAHVNWSSNWDLLLLLLLLQTLVAPLHLDVVLAAWRRKAWHLVDVQEEEVQEEAGA